ncbi:plasminogen-like [Ostrea edulis]|uniref:plasminogen-like n=1 Tax=Ostrea edulis TaxID=37623 RepID=UPI0024AEF07F|nr:plasminogen-like [Ostrea edulis]
MYFSKNYSTYISATICIWLVWCILSRCDEFRSSYFRFVPEAVDMEPQIGIMSDSLNCHSVSSCGIQCLSQDNCQSFFYNGFQERCVLTGVVNFSSLRTSLGFSHFSINDCIQSRAGWGYRGERHHTVNGRLCQRWDQQTPHTHNYGNLSDHENFCRNVHLDRDEDDGPWCYTTDSGVRWESCGLPLCYDFTRNCSTTSNGIDYYGKTNVTKSGAACNFWSDTSTRAHRYAFLTDQENYCRNPFGDESAPWCYTGASWDYCDINAC